MTISPILKAAFDNIDKWEKEQKEAEASGDHDSSAAEATEEDFAQQLNDAEVEVTPGLNPDRWGPNGEDKWGYIDETRATLDEDDADEWNKNCDAVINAAVEGVYGTGEYDTSVESTNTPEDDEQPADTSPDNWQHVSEAAQPHVRKTIQIKGLDEKAVLVQLKRSMFGTSSKDLAETEKYGAGTVHKHLFEDKTCRMASVKQAYSEVYTFVNENTVPWAKGVRMLNIDHYWDFTQGLRKRIDHATKQVDILANNWDYEVQKDLDRLTQIENAKGKAPGSLANPANYPDASEIGDKFGIDVRYMPVPTAGDFRVTISDEDKASLQKQLEEAEDNAARHVIEEMLEPMQRAVEKLNVPIGQDGSIFRDSLIDNMVDVADRMERVNVSDDPVVAEKIKDLRALVAAYADNKDVLRNSQTVRRKAASQIDDLVQQMGGLV